MVMEVHSEVERKMAAWQHLVFAIFAAALCCIEFSSAASRANCECGLASEDSLQMRIVGGHNVVPHSLPWLVAILNDGDTHCGGALVSDRHVLSAGHCVRWNDFRKMTALLGLHDMNQLIGVETRKFSKSVIHENFKSNLIRDEHDIAMFTLDRPIHFNDKIRPICLPQPGSDFTGYMATIAGWGRVAEGKTTSKKLLKANLKIISHEQCKEQPRMTHEVTSSMICGFYKGRDGCQGDSGGPLMVVGDTGKYVQVGIVSWGIGCADPRFPGVYTRVSMYTDWINKQIADGTICRN